MGRWTTNMTIGKENRASVLTVLRGAAWGKYTERANVKKGRWTTNMAKGRKIRPMYWRY